MELYLFLLNLIGYALYEKRFVENIDNEPLDITIKNGSIIPVKRNKEKNNTDISYYFIFGIKCIYNIGILIILTWQLIYSIIVSIKQHNGVYFGANFFQVIFISQYILGVIYFANKHFYNKIKIDTKIKNKLKLFYSSAIIISFILSITFIVLTATKKQISKMSILNEYQNSSELNMIILFFTLFYGYSTFLINMITFSIIMTEHKNEATEFTEEINKYIKGSVNPSEKLNSISREVNKLRSNYDKSVTKLNKIFSSVTIFGLIYASFTLKLYKNESIDPFSMINLILFLLTEYIYIISAKRIRESSKEILKKVNDYIRASSLLKTNEIKKDTEFLETTENSTEEIIKILYINVAEITERLSWVQLRETIEIEWTTFNIFGIELKDTLLFEKLIGLVFAFLVANDLVDILSF